MPSLWLKVIGAGCEIVFQAIMLSVGPLMWYTKAPGDGKVGFIPWGAGHCGARYSKARCVLAGVYPDQDEWMIMQQGMFTPLEN